MLKTVRNLFHVKPLRKKILFTLGMIALIRFVSQVPIPGIDLEYYKQWIGANDGAFNLLSAFTGGSFENFSFLCLGITPYITATIITQLLSVVFPQLEEIQKDGEYGRKKMEKINFWASLGLALLEGASMVIGFSRSGIFTDMTILKGILAVACMIAGSALCVWAGDRIKKKGIGNGISIVLMVNIISGLPSSLETLFENYVFTKKLAKGCLAAAIIIAILFIAVLLVVAFNEAQRKIPVQYSRKVQGRKMVGASSTSIPLKINPAGVIPVIFAASLYSLPQMVAAIAGKGYGSGISAFILNSLSQGNWFNLHHMEYTVGAVFYIALIIFFGYFYTSISFNPMEVADNLKKQGGMIPGIRPGKPTEEYLTKVTNRLIFIGSIGLVIVVFIPIICCGLSGASVSFGGTSIVIVAGVVLETLQQIDSEMFAHNYEGFLMGGK